MNICYFIRSLRLETLAHLRVFVFGALCGVAVFAPFAQGNPTPTEPLPIVHLKNCDELWNTPFSELSAAEAEMRMRCDEDEAIAQYWSEQAQEAMQKEME